MASVILPSVPSESGPGRFGVYGGRYVPETLMAALVELEHEYDIAKSDAAFQAELAGLLELVVVLVAAAECGRAPLDEQQRRSGERADGSETAEPAV